MIVSRPARPGAASLALLLILVITAAWWALALWPAGAVEPEWLLRTRAACFGSVPGGLPNAGGWILLIGEPLGMLGALFIVWGEALRADLRRLYDDQRWHPVLLAVPALVLLGVVASGQRVAFATGFGATAPESPAGTLLRVDVDAAAFVLTDQTGRRLPVGGVAGRHSLLTFAFGHCATVCPTIVHDIRRARAAANRPQVPIVIISLDPWRDTPARLPTIASTWELGPDDRVLSGTVEEVERVLDALGVARQRDLSTGDIAHTGSVMSVNERGRVTWRLDGGWGGVTELLAAMPAPTNK